MSIYIIFKIDPEEMRDVSHQMAHDMLAGINSQFTAAFWPFSLNFLFLQE